MKIGITLYSNREIHFLLSNQFLSLINNDNENEYFIFCDDPKVIEGLFQGAKHVQVIKYYQGKRWNRFIYWYILYQGERYNLLREKTVGDHDFFMQQHRYSNRFFYTLGYLFSSVFKIFPKIVNPLRWLSYRSSYYEKYSLDKCLLTQYHSFKEQCFAYNNQKASLIFFPNSHDSFTIEPFGVRIDKILSWHTVTSEMMESIHNFRKELITEVGNPSHERLRGASKMHQLDEKEILIFGSNNFVHNETEMVEDIYKNKYLQSLGIKLRIAPSVGGVGEEWYRRYHFYEEMLGKENLYLPSKQWMKGSDYDKNNINQEYEQNILSHRVFIVSGVSNVAYDVMARGGVLILIFYESDTYTKGFPWWECKNREVLRHVYDYPGIFICHNVREIEETLKSNFPNKDFYSNTPYRQELNSSELLFHELTA
tara:strand:+ start:11 stop:1285 length:1275 start_codon:yes stop_codon:yes gene_type:complete